MPIFYLNHPELTVWIVTLNFNEVVTVYVGHSFSYSS